MDALKQIYELLAGYAVRWRTRGGFFRVLIALLLVTDRLVKYFEAPKGVTVDAFVTVGVVWLVVWIVGSGRVAIPRTNLTVIFAFDVEVAAELNFGRAFISLSTTLRSLPVSEAISVRRIASDLIRDRRAAERYCENFKVDQVVWGRGSSGKSDNRVVNTFDVSFTQISRRGLTPTDFAFIAEAMRTLWAGREWKVRDENDLADDDSEANLRKVFRKNFHGIMLAIDDRFSDAVIVLDRVVNGLRRRAATTPSKHVDSCFRTFADDGLPLQSCFRTLADHGSQLRSCLRTFADDGLPLRSCFRTFADDGLPLRSCFRTFADDGLQLRSCFRTFADHGLQLRSCLRTFADDGLPLRSCLRTFADDGSQLRSCFRTFADDGLQLRSCFRTFADGGLQLRSCFRTFADDGLQLQSCLRTLRTAVCSHQMAFALPRVPVRRVGMPRRAFVQRAARVGERIPLQCAGLSW